MPIPSIVMDTNVFIAALWSRRGASFRLLSLVGEGYFDLNISVPLMLEYEAVAKREIESLEPSDGEIDGIWIIWP